MSLIIKLSVFCFLCISCSEGRKEPTYISIKLGSELHPEGKYYKPYKVKNGSTVYSVLSELKVFDKEFLDFTVFKAHPPYGVFVIRGEKQIDLGIFYQIKSGHNLNILKSFNLKQDDELNLSPCGDCCTKNGMGVENFLIY